MLGDLQCSFCKSTINNYIDELLVQKKLGAEHVNVATCYFSLGNLHHTLGETDQAKDYHKHALEITLKKLGPEHVDVAHSYHKLGSIYNGLGEFEEAKHCLDRASVIYIAKYG